MQTMPPMESAVTKYGYDAVQPSAKKTKHVNNRVATVIPEIGFEDEPTSPVNLDETVTNKNPRTMIRRAPRNETTGSFKMNRPSEGESMIAASSTISPTITHFIEISWSVRSVPFIPDEPRKSAMPDFKPLQI